MFDTNSYIPEGTVLNPYKPREPKVPNTDNDAFYASVLSQSDDPVGVYEAIELERRSNDGLSDIITNVRNFYKQQNDTQKALLIEEIIADESIDRESKKQILESYTLGTEDFNLKDEYLNFLTNTRVANLPEVNDDDLELLDLKINKLKAEQEIENAFANPKPSGNLPLISKNVQQTISTIGDLRDTTTRETVNAFQVFLQVFPLLLEVAGTTAYQGASALGEKAEIDFLKKAYPDVDWETARGKVSKVLKTEEYAEWLNELAIKYIPNYKEGDISKGAVATVAEYFMKGLEWVGETTTPEDPTKGRTLAELLLFTLGSQYRLANRVVEKGTGKFSKFVRDTAEKARVKVEESQRFKRAKTVYPEGDGKVTYQPTANKYDPFEPKKNSPFVEATETNPTFAKDLTEILFEDVSGKAWEAVKITPEQFLMKFYGPRIYDVDISRTRLYDATDATNLKFINQKLDFYRQQQNIDSVFVDTPERLQYTNYTIQDIGGILSDPSIRMIGSDLVVKTDGVSLYTTTSFRKANGEFYTNAREALVYARVIEDSLQNSQATKGGGVRTSDDLIIESYDLDGVINSDMSRSIEDFAKDVAKDPNKIGNYSIRWQRINDFTEVIRDRATGYGNTEYLNYTGPASLFKSLFTSSTNLDNWLFNYGTLSRELQKTRDIAGLKGFNVLDRELKELSEMATKWTGSFNRDLLTLLERKADYFYKNQRPSLTGYRRIDKNDIVNILGYRPERDKLNELFYANNLIEDMNYFKWQNNNVFEINRGIKAGYVNHVTIPDPVTGTPYNYLVKSPEEPLRLNPESFSEILDLATKEPAGFSPTLYKFDNGKHYITDTDGVPYKQIVRLGKEYTRDEIVELPSADGQLNRYPITAKYNYVAIGMETKLGGIPDFLVPFRQHYMPMLVDGNVFLRRYPKVSKTDGVLRDLTRESDDVIAKEHKNFRQTIGSFKTRKSAEVYKEKELFESEKMIDKDSFIYKIEKADELSWTDTNELMRLQEAAIRTASRKGDHLQTAIYRDPLESMIETSKLLGTKGFYQLVLEQQKIGWVERWGKDPLVTIQENQQVLNRSQKAAARLEPVDLEASKYDNFPLGEEQINPTSNSKESLIAANQAKKEWKAITQVVNGFPDDAAANFMHGVGELIEKAGIALPKGTYLEQAGYALQKSPGIIGDKVRGFVTTSLVIYSAFWKHWLQQPFMGLGYLTVAEGWNPASISLRMYNALATIAYAGLDSSLINRTKTGQKYRDKYRQKAYDAFVKNFGKDPVFKNTKGFNRTFEQTAYLYESMYNRGVFNLAEHTLAKGFLNNKTRSLDAGAVSRGTSKVTDFFSKASVQTGEQVHRALAAEAAINIWESQNPGKTWYKNEKAMDQIAQWTRQMTQSMDRMANNTFQRVGVIKAVAHLQTFMARLNEQFIIPEGTPFTGWQRAQLAGWSFMASGIKGIAGYGIPGYIIYKAVAELFGEDIADMLDKGILLDIALVHMLDSLFPTYDKEGNQIFTTTRPSKYINPLGNKEDVGLFYFDIIKGAAAFAGMTDLDSIQNIAFQHLRKMYANIDLMIISLGMEKQTDEQIMAGLETFAKFTGLGKTMLNFFLYDTLNKTRYTQQGQATEAATSNVDRMLSLLLNSQPEETTSQFNTLRRWRGNKKLIQELANETFDAVRLGLGTKKLSPEEIKNAIGSIAYHLKETHNLKESDMKLFWDTIDMKNNQNQRSIKQNIMQELVDLLQADKDKLNDAELTALQEILRRVQENPNAHPDYQYLLDSIRNRSKGDIGATEKIYKLKEELQEKINEAKDKYTIEVKPGD